MTAPEASSGITRKTAGAFVYNICTVAAADPFMTPASIPEDSPDDKAEEDGNKQGTSDERDERCLIRGGAVSGSFQ